MNIKNETLEAQQFIADRIPGITERRADGTEWMRAIILPGRDTLQMPEPVVLHNTFKAPYLLRIDSNEYSSFCPAVGQPDYATFNIQYVPDTKLIEQKCFRDFVVSFRTADMFQEEVALTFAWWLAHAIDPLWMRVQFNFTPRGGQHGQIVFAEGKLPESLRDEVTR